VNNNKVETETAAAAAGFSNADGLAGFASTKGRLTLRMLGC
jgi:hypothetical protein